MIKIENLGFSYGESVVLKNITMTLEEGKIYGLLGENGVGKTTLLTLLCGLKNVKTGSINVDGHTPYKREPSFLSNQYYLSDEVPEVNMKAVDYARNYGKFWEKFDMDKFIEIMDVFENDPQKKMNRMSFGQLKKTYISFALACNCKYIFMDEPTNGLDIPSKAQFRKAVTKYTSEDSTLLISTHQVRDLENIIDPIIILDRQDVLLNASISEISEKLYFDYSNEIRPGALYSEMTPGGCVQVTPNATGEDSRVNIEALFNTVHLHKDIVKGMFSK
ncbi:MAG: ATP-binding cassette domain-containing protein [Bacteroidales bacterium]|nr:ATP-binding cassette domain-containing protein [Bacteroides sp.]MCM1199201.1 ATP-binding cassette domain-containing protein [Clostridium sp.]MCM1501616.1 ATP-binding cassette domain-containing protein [Bacteroidales bacterium]